MPGKFDNRRDEMLYTMSLEGWATDSGGNVEAPTGWFAYMTNTKEEVESIRQAFPDFSDVTDEEIIGSFLLEEDERGFFYVTKDSEGKVKDFFTRQRAFFDKWNEEE